MSKKTIVAKQDVPVCTDPFPKQAYGAGVAPENTSVPPRQSLACDCALMPVNERDKWHTVLRDKKPVGRIWYVRQPKQRGWWGHLLTETKRGARGPFKTQEEAAQHIAGIAKQ